jgi:hypothetical protein
VPFPTSALRVLQQMAEVPIDVFELELELDPECNPQDILFTVGGVLGESGVVFTGPTHDETSDLDRKVIESKMLKAAMHPVDMTGRAMALHSHPHLWHIIYQYPVPLAIQDRSTWSTSCLSPWTGYWDAQWRYWNAIDREVWSRAGSRPELGIDDLRKMVHTKIIDNRMTMKEAREALWFDQS